MQTPTQQAVAALQPVPCTTCTLAHDRRTTPGSCPFHVANGSSCHNHRAESQRIEWRG